MSQAELTRTEAERITIKVSTQGYSIPVEKMCSCPTSYGMKLRMRPLYINQLVIILNGINQDELEAVAKAEWERKLSRILSRVIRVLGGYDGSSLEVFTKEVACLKANGITVGRILPQENTSNSPARELATTTA